MSNLDLPGPEGGVHTEDDLRWFVTNEVEESDRLEYKAAMYGRGDDEKREMLRDITAMANHRGGRIVIGIEENRDGVAAKIVGVTPAQNPPHHDWIRQVCLHNIDERIRGLDVYEIPLSNGNVVVVIDIPESITAPHMVTLKGLNQFWRRHGSHKLPMSVDEIRDVFLQAANRTTRIERLFERRKQEILNEINGECFVVFAALPYHFHGDRIVNVVDVKNRGKMVYSPLTSWHGMVTIDSVRVVEPYIDDMVSLSEVDEYLELFDNGLIEYGERVKRDRDGYSIPSTKHAWTIRYVSDFLRDIYAREVTDGPVIVRMTIYNCKGIVLGVGTRINPRGGYIHLTKVPPDGCLIVGDFVVESLTAEAAMLPKRICDRLWNAFGQDRAACFNDRGQIINEFGQVVSDPRERARA